MSRIKYFEGENIVDGIHYASIYECASCTRQYVLSGTRGAFCPYCGSTERAHVLCAADIKPVKSIYKLSFQTGPDGVWMGSGVFDTKEEAKRLFDMMESAFPNFSMNVYQVDGERYQTIYKREYSREGMNNADYTGQ